MANQMGCWQGEAPPVLKIANPPAGVVCAPSLGDLVPAFSNEHTRLAIAPLVWSTEAQEALAGISLTREMLLAGRGEIGNNSDRYRPAQNFFAANACSLDMAATVVRQAFRPHPHQEALIGDLSRGIAIIQQALAGRDLKMRIEAQGPLFRGFWHSDMNTMTATVPLTPGEGMLAQTPSLLTPSIFSLPASTDRQTWVNVWNGKMRPSRALWHHHARCQPPYQLRALLNVSDRV